VTNGGMNSVRVLEGAGNGTYQSAAILAVGTGPVAITAGDWNADGNLDLAVADAGLGLNADVSVLMGSGDGAFMAPRSYEVALHAWGVAVGDFNEDGVPDLAVSTYHGNRVSVLLGNGDGTFRTALHFATGNFCTGLVVADFDADGHLDLAVTG